MALDKLVSSLVSDAKKEAEEVVNSAEWHVGKMVSEEKAKRAILVKAAAEEAEVMIEAQRKEKIAWARLEAKRLISEAKEDAIKGCLESFFEEMKSARDSKQYQMFLNKVVSSALKELGASKATVHLLKGDKKYFKNGNGKVTVVEDISTAGGALVETEDGRIRVDMTLESLFESRKDDLRKEIYAILFGG